MSTYPTSCASSSSRSPDFDSPNDRFGYPFGLIIYYSWNFLATIILVNVLIALFGSAYSDVEENATDEYLAFFAHKTIDLSKSLLLVGDMALMNSPST
jgi:hypothetical protein